MSQCPCLDTQPHNRMLADTIATVKCKQSHRVAALTADPISFSLQGPLCGKIARRQPRLAQRTEPNLVCPRPCLRHVPGADADRQGWHCASLHT